MYLSVVLVTRLLNMHLRPVSHGRVRYLAYDMRPCETGLKHIYHSLNIINHTTIPKLTYQRKYTIVINLVLH